jgi:hybrid cluster-associated redox disulfide protein
MPIGQVIGEHPETVPIFLKNGLSCIGCPMASMETVEQGALSHGIDVDKLVKELNAGEKKPTKKKTK